MSTENQKPTLDEIKKLIFKLEDINFSRGVQSLNNQFLYEEASKITIEFTLKLLEKIRAYGCNHE